MTGRDRSRPPIEALIERHLPGLRNYVRKNMGAELAQRESCADLVQSICREALQSPGDYEFRSDDAFRKWLLQIALRKLVDRRRFYSRRKRENVARESELSDGWRIEELAKLAKTLGSPSGEASLREDVQRLGRALERLDEDDRDVIRLVYLDGLTHSDVAERLGCTASQSRGRLFLALARLGTHLKAGKR
jgi:RNA polymerase sigma-70 factor (ECF subfamily)